MPTIAIIRPDCEVDDVELMEIVPNEFMQVIIDTIGLPAGPQVPEGEEGVENAPHGGTEIVLERDNKIFQLTHYTGESNRLASLLTINGMEIDGVAVLSAVSPDLERGIDSLLSVTMDDIRYMIRAKTHHWGVKIDPDCNVDLEAFEFEDVQVAPDGYKPCEYSVFKYNLFMYAEPGEEGKSLNKRATIILGRKVYGDVYVGHKLQENLYGDLSCDELNKIISMSAQERSKVDMTSEELEDEEKNGLPVIKNRFKILRDRWVKYRDICNNCPKPAKSRCGKCYQLRYCSPHCQKQDWIFHKKYCTQVQQQKSVNAEMART